MKTMLMFIQTFDFLSWVYIPIVLPICGGVNLNIVWSLFPLPMIFFTWSSWSSKVWLEKNQHSYFNASMDTIAALKWEYVFWNRVFLLHEHHVKKTGSGNSDQIMLRMTPAHIGHSICICRPMTRSQPFEWTASCSCFLATYPNLWKYW